MKKKFVVALLTTIALTVGTVGTVFADSQVKNTDVKAASESHEGMVWVVDKEAWTETVNHPEEGHMEQVFDWTEYIGEAGHMYCYCGYDFGAPNGDNEALGNAIRSHRENDGCPSEGYRNWQSKVDHYKDEWVVDKPAWTETINHPEEGHWEPVKDDTDTPTPEKPEPEAPAPEAPTPEKPEPEAPAPEAPTPEKPEPEAPAPEAPTPEKPEPEAPAPEAPTPEKPEPEAPAPEAPTPEKPEPEAPAPEAPTPEKPEPEAPAPEAPTSEAPESSSISGSATASQNSATATEKGQEKRTSPKTGDASNFMYLLALAGSAVTGGGALGLKFRKRK